MVEFHVSNYRYIQIGSGDGIVLSVVSYVVS